MFKINIDERIQQFNSIMLTLVLKVKNNIISSRGSFTHILEALLNMFEVKIWS